MKTVASASKGIINVIRVVGERSDGSALVGVREGFEIGASIIGSY